MEMMKIIRQLLEVPSTDPDDQRRRRLLNILILGVAALTLLAVLATTVYDIISRVEEREATLLYVGSLALLVGLVITYAINRYGSSQIASSLFLLLLTIVLAFTDEPQEVADGRTLFVFTIPILIASVSLRPYASFIVAGLVSLLIAAIGLSVQIVPNAFAMIVFFCHCSGILALGP